MGIPRWLVFALVLAPAGAAVAQVPPGGRRIVGEGDSGSGTGATLPGRATIVTAIVKLAPLRTWTNGEGREILAELVSWPIEGAGAAEKDLAELDVEVVREGKVRLRLAGKVVPVLLATLSEADRAFVAAVREKVGDVPPVPEP